MHSTSLIRTATVALVAGTVLATSGCGWFRKGNVFAQPAETRPLEVPPDLDRPAAAGVAATPAPASVTRSQMTAAQPAMSLGFAVPGSRDAVYERVGQALDGIAGVTVSSRAVLLGSYDVNYQASNFLIRVVQQSETSSYVSAVDPRGVAPEGPAAAQLIDQLRAQLGGG